MSWRIVTLVSEVGFTDLRDGEPEDAFRINQRRTPERIEETVSTVGWNESGARNTYEEQTLILKKLRST